VIRVNPQRDFKIRSNGLRLEVEAFPTDTAEIQAEWVSAIFQVE